MPCFKEALSVTVTQSNVSERHTEKHLFLQRAVEKTLAFQLSNCGHTQNVFKLLSPPHMVTLEEMVETGLGEKWSGSSNQRVIPFLSLYIE